MTVTTGFGPATTGLKPQNHVSSYQTVLVWMLPAFAVVLGFSAILNVLMLTGSIYMLQVYDRVLGSGSVPTLLGLFAIVVVLYGFFALYDFLRARMTARIALQLDSRLRKDAFRHGFERDGSGATLADLDALRLYLSSPAVNALFDLPFMPLFLAVLFYLHPLFGWVTVGGALVAIVIAATGRWLAARPQQRATMLNTAERDFAASCRMASEAVRAMRMQAAITSHWSAARETALASAQAGDETAQALAAISRGFRMLLQSAILTVGAWLVIDGQVSAGMIIASSILSGRALAPVDQLIGQSRSLGRMLLAHKRLTAAFMPGGAPAPALQLPDPSGQIDASGITVRARKDSDSAEILSGLDFQLKPGDGLGVIGKSASGKSTLARILVGAEQADAGEIRYDGATADQWDPTRLGRAIGYLPQQVTMLPGTVRDNIARFDAQISDDDVIEAARRVGIHDMILNLPEGYSTRLGGSEAARLSGGQVQRLGLARAICGQPAIIVLDEPNSNLDAEGDDALTEAIRMMRKRGSTVIIMAHRPSAIAAVDRLMVLENGKIRAFGSKHAILAQLARRDPSRGRPPALLAPKAQENAFRLEGPEQPSANLCSSPDPAPDQDDGHAAEPPLRLTAPASIASLAGPAHKRAAAR